MTTNIFKLFGLLAVWGALLIGAWSWDAKPLWVLFYAVSAIIVYVCLLFMLSLQRAWLVERVAPSLAVQGDQAEVRIELGVVTWLPLLWTAVEETWLHVQTGTRYTRVLLLMPGYRRRLSAAYKLGPLARGIYRLERLELATGDPFGILEKRLLIEVQAELAVLPRPYPVERLRFGEGEGGQARSLHLPIGGLPDSIRSYMPGDPMNRIHWPSLAKADELRMRVTGSAEPVSTVVCLDGSRRLTAGGGDMFEQAVRIAAGLLVQHERGEDRCELSVFEDGNEEGGRLIMPAAYHRLAYVAAEASNDRLDRYLDRLRSNAPLHSRIIFISSELNDSKVNRLVAFNERRRGLLVICFQTTAMPSAEERDRIGRLRQAGCGVISVPVARSVPTHIHGGGAPYVSA